MMLFLIVTFLIIHLYKKFNGQNFNLKVSKEKVLQQTRSQENPLENFPFPVKREKANSQKGKHICSTVNDFQMEFLTTIKIVSLFTTKRLQYHNTNKNVWFFQSISWEPLCS